MGLKTLSSGAPKVTLLRTLLPRVDNPRKAISGLEGRWFGPLRWLGHSEEDLAAYKAEGVIGRSPEEPLGQLLK